MILFRFLTANAAFQQKVDQAASVVLERQRIVERLETVITNLESRDGKGSICYTTTFPDDEIAESLVVSFNAGVDPNPHYSHIITGRIYVTKDGELMLGYWPLDKTSYRIESLLQNIHKLEWQFLEKKMDQDPKVPVLQNGSAWLKHWPEARQEAPEIIRLKIWCGKQEEPDLQFAFIRPVLTPISLAK